MFFLEKVKIWKIVYEYFCSVKITLNKIVFRGFFSLISPGPRFWSIYLMDNAFLCHAVKILRRSFWLMNFGHATAPFNTMICTLKFRAMQMFIPCWKNTLIYFDNSIILWKECCQGKVWLVVWSNYTCRSSFGFNHKLKIYPINLYADYCIIMYIALQWGFFKQTFS